MFFDVWKTVTGAASQDHDCQLHVQHPKKWPNFSGKQARSMFQQNASRNKRFSNAKYPLELARALTMSSSSAARIASGGGLHVRVVQPNDETFDASQNLDKVNSFIQAYDACGQGRSLDTLDLFAGEGNFEKACREQNLRSEGVELKRDPVGQNLLHAQGFNATLRLVLAVAPCFWYSLNFELSSLFFQPPSPQTFARCPLPFRGGIWNPAMWTALWPLCVLVQLLSPQNAPVSLRQPGKREDQGRQPVGHQLHGSLSGS